jgi:spore maturation protein CgeB
MSGGIYNMLAGFSVGLHDAMLRKGLEVKYTPTWVKEDIIPEFSLGFNISCGELWDIILRSGMLNVMWTVDSLFYHNVEEIRKYGKAPNFKCICLSNDDDDATEYFMPYVQKICLPLAIDPEVWYSENQERPKDIVFLASIKEPDEIIAEAEAMINDSKLLSDYKKMYRYALRHPEKNMWQVFKDCGVLSYMNMRKIPKEQQYQVYKMFMLKLSYVISYQKRIDLVNSISDLNVEVYGNGPWEKHIKGNVKYMGPVDLLEAQEVLSKSKIAINLQPMQILSGIHDRIMNASASGALVFTDKNQKIFESYGDSLCYFNPTDFKGLAEQLKFFLKNEDKRLSKAKQAQQITLAKHTWDNRVEELLGA